MKFVVLFLLLLAMHFNLTPFAPAQKAWFGWPFGLDTKSWLPVVGGLPSQSGSIISPLLAGLAGLGFLVAALGLFWAAIPAGYWPAVVVGSTAASIVLFLLYISPWAVFPLLLDTLLLWGVFGWNWTSSALRGI